MIYVMTYDNRTGEPQVYDWYYSPDIAASVVSDGMKASTMYTYKTFTTKDSFLSNKHRNFKDVKP